jgi:MFS family permease
MASLLGYNLAIGFAYFLVEVMLIQACHSVFLSPSASLILVLAVLLVGSGCGGMLAGRVSLPVVTGLLTALLLVGVGVPDRMLAGGWTPSLVTGTAVVMIFGIGVLMGVFFPAGLQLADRWSMRDKIPHLFAINSVAGSLATVAALYLGIRVGYRWTLLLAVLLYGSAALIYLRHARARPKSPLPADAGHQPPTGEQPARSQPAAVTQAAWACDISALPPAPHEQ